MSILIVIGHPSPASFSHAIATRCESVLSAIGYQVVCHDLQAEGFDPVLPATEIPREVILGQDVESHCRELSEAEGIIVIHPNWWGMPPAVLKGWIDRVFRADVAYRFVEGDDGEGVPVGLLKAKAAVVFNTSNTAMERELNVFGDPLEALWKKCIFDLCGVKRFERRMFETVVTSTPEQRLKWLNEVEAIVVKTFGK